MKIVVYLFFISIILAGNSNYVYSQSNPADEDATQMLKSFYTMRSTIKYIVKDIPKIDSLQKKYCTINLQKKLKEEYKANGLDHDLLTNDNGIDPKALNTISISKAPGKINRYIVSYINHTIDANNKPIIEKVVSHVIVVKEDGRFKIASVQ